MSNEWLKIKIVRDHNKIYNENYYSSGLWIANEQSKIRNSYPKKYINLLELIRNKWIYNYLNSGYLATPKKLSISDLDNIDIDLFEKVCRFNNISIVNMPLFTLYKKGNILSKSVLTLHIDSLEHIKNHQNIMFYIYQIDKYGGRWYQEEDNGLVKRNRKEKIKKLEQI